MSTFYFNTGVNPDRFLGRSLPSGHVLKGGVLQVPFNCEGVPAGSSFMFACDDDKLPESTFPNVTVCPIVPGSALLSKFAYFRTSNV